MRLRLALASLLLAAPLHAQPAPDATTPAGFVRTAAMSDMYEIQAGRLAESKGQSAQVKDFGRQMVAGHTQTTQQLTAVAAQANVTATPPARLDAQHQTMLSQLQAAPPAQFDQVYLQQQDQAHRQALMLMQTYASQGTAEPLRGFARQTAPVIQGHLTMLGQMQGGATMANR
jgi:putative membrane protein